MSGPESLVFEHDQEIRRQKRRASDFGGAEVGQGCRVERLGGHEELGERLELACRVVGEGLAVPAVRLGVVDKPVAFVIVALDASTPRP